MASSLLHRTLRLSFSSSLLCRNRHSCLYSAIASARSSHLIRRAVPQDLAKFPSFLSLRFASIKVGADENLKRVLESEIKCAYDTQETELPEGFPFEIIDNPGDQTITLKREFAGEKIEASVFMDVGEEDDANEDDEKDSGDDNDDVSVQSPISLVVTIDKGEGALEFCCNLNADELTIDAVSLKRHDESDESYQGPPFSDLDEKLQESFHKYLEVRGFTSSLFDFLHEYMMNKDDREYVAWLKNMKEFVEK